MQPWGWLQKAGRSPQAGGREQGWSPRAAHGWPCEWARPRERPASVLVHGAGTRGQSTPQPAVRLPGCRPGHWRGVWGLPWRRLAGRGGGGRPDYERPRQLSSRYAPAWEARRPERMCPHMEMAPTSPGAAPPRPPAGHSGIPQPLKSRNPPRGLWPAKPGPAGNSGARRVSQQSPAAGHPEAPSGHSCCCW